MGFVSFRPKVYRSIAVVALVAVTSLYLNGTLIPLPENQTSGFLGDFQYRSGSAWQVGLFGNRTSWDSMNHFLRLQGEYDYQRNYGLLDPYSEARYHHTFSRLAGDALENFISYHSDGLKDGVRSGLSRVVDFERLRANHSSLVVVGVLAAIYTGRTVHYRINSDIALESQTLLRSETKQYIGWSLGDYGASGGGTYDAAAKQAGFAIHKRISANVSLDYEMSAEHSVGVNYSKGF